MKSSFRNLVLAVIVCVLSLIITTNVAIAADYNADARYREGSFIAMGLQHAGLRKAGVGIYEIRGPFTTIQLSSWTTFLDGKTYVGAFINPIMNDTDRDNILITAAQMDADPDISYTASGILYHEAPAGSYVHVDDITDIRCDGVVEYAYEWRNIWIWGRSNTGTSSGTPTNFDVSWSGYVGEHNNLGKDQPWIETSPIVQHGGSGTNWTKLRQYY